MPNSHDSSALLSHNKATARTASTNVVQTSRIFALLKTNVVLVGTIFATAASTETLRTALWSGMLGYALLGRSSTQPVSAALTFKPGWC